jgi:hypothetical protein
MKIIKRKIHIKANVTHVNKYISDINIFHKELLKLNDNKDIKINLHNNVLEVVGKEPLLTFTVQYSDKQNGFMAVVTPTASNLKRFGIGTLTCKLYDNNGTDMITQLNSDKTPNIIWRIFIKFMVFIIMFQSKSYERKFISNIEQSA